MKELYLTVIPKHYLWCQREKKAIFPAQVWSSTASRRAAQTGTGDQSMLGQWVGHWGSPMSKEKRNQRDWGGRKGLECKAQTFSVQFILVCF